MHALDAVCLALSLSLSHSPSGPVPYSKTGRRCILYWHLAKVRFSFSPPPPMGKLPPPAATPYAAHAHAHAHATSHSINTTCIIIQLLFLFLVSNFAYTYIYRFLVPLISGFLAHDLHSFMTRRKVPSPPFYLFIYIYLSCALLCQWPGYMLGFHIELAFLLVL